eukprot:scaffold128341_cov32-Tisochrysis_lutea.AAC.1
MASKCTLMRAKLARCCSSRRLVVVMSAPSHSVLGYATDRHCSSTTADIVAHDFCEAPSCTCPHSKRCRIRRCVSTAGTHLGHNLPDAKGNRYCINLVSVAGRPTQGKPVARYIGPDQ